jgi:hypothetical protein
MHGYPKVARNRKIFADRAKGLTMLQIAEAHGLSYQRVCQILINGCGGKTLGLLPGTEKLTSGTRGLLVRMGYRSVDAVLADLKRGKLYVGCAAGIGPGRFAELEAWAREQESIRGL